MRISWTISWYIFKDLLKIFMMASGALAGIMSFGGLLRPLTQQGLELSQAGQLLTYFTPAMMAYSLPVAALFAATVVYGRLSADNELTACRACGISHLSVAVPATVLGLIVALGSFMLLSFIVPAATLQAEKIVYSNIAKLISNEINRSHQLRLQQDEITVFAQEARVPTLSSSAIKAGEQQVVLISPTIVTFDRPRPKEQSYRVPRDFYTAGRATVFISRGKTDDRIQLTIELENGVRLSRQLKDSVEARVGSLRFGPLERAASIREKVKFMNAFELQHYYSAPEESSRISELQQDFLDRRVQFAYIWGIRDELKATGKTVFRTLNNDQYEIGVSLPLPQGGLIEEKAGDLLISPEKDSRAASSGGTRERRVQLMHIVNGKVDSVTSAAEARIRANPRREDGRIDVSVALIDAAIATPEGPAIRRSLPRDFEVALDPKIKALENTPLSEILDSEDFKGSKDHLKLYREVILLNNEIMGEYHARASFAISCLILVMVGCALGMMFRSGNFLTAFAVSFVPALISITLTIAGQRVCENIGWNVLDPTFQNPRNLGLTLIWSGNLANFAIATSLLWRLWRT